MTVFIKAGQAILASKQNLAEWSVNRQYQLKPEIWRPYGEKGRAFSLRDTAYHLVYLSEALIAEDPQLFIEYVAWVKALFANLNFPPDVLPDTLRCMQEAIRGQIPFEEEIVACEYIEIGISSLTQAPVIPTSFLVKDAPLAELALQYFELLLKGQRNSASRIIMDAVHLDATIQDIYIQVFQRSQREIGRLWQINQISVAQEHYCTAATQLIMAQLYPYILTGAKSSRKMIATCVGGELHEIGARMVADFFEMEGWDTLYLGANTPDESVVRMVVDQKPDLLALSATMTFHINKVADLITAVKAVGSPVRILVGGYPFNLSRDLWKKVGADGSASDAQEAITVANDMFSQYNT